MKTLHESPPVQPARSTQPQPQPQEVVRPTVGLKRILVPTDFSPASLLGVEYAVKLAEEFHAHVVLLHVVEEIVAPEFSAYAALVDESELKKRMRERLDALVQEKKITHDLLEQAVVRRGTPYHEIAQVAEKLQADLIVIATHGYTGLKHVLLGSTAERVVRHARCPVLVVPAKPH